MEKFKEGDTVLVRTLQEGEPHYILGQLLTIFVVLDKAQYVVKYRRPGGGNMYSVVGGEALTAAKQEDDPELFI